MKIDEKKFRAELKKIMPGYSWTIHRSSRYAEIDRERHKDDHRVATGTQSAGSNRTSTLRVKKRVRVVNGRTEAKYTAKSSGFGKSAPWLGEAKGDTLAQALRALQEHYERTASNYAGHAAALRKGRDKPDGE